MSTFPIPGVPMPDAKRPERMNEDMNRLVPRDIAGAVNLMVHPLAGAAAFSALGIGLASHAFGVWVGALSGAAEMSQRLLDTVEDGMASRAAQFDRRRGPARQRAASAARALIADARSAVLDPQQTGAEPAGSAAASTGAQAGNAGADAAASAGLQLQSQARPAAPDDLKAISGIGPKLETLLNGLGIWSYAQIAGWSDADIERVNRHLSFNGRVERDDWVGQAKTLAANRDRH